MVSIHACIYSLHAQYSMHIVHIFMVYNNYVCVYTHTHTCVILTSTLIRECICEICDLLKIRVLTRLYVPCALLALALNEHVKARNKTVLSTYIPT